MLAVAAYEASLRAVAARPGIVASAGLWARQVQRSLADEHPDVTVVLGASRAMSGFSSSVFRHRHPDVPIYFLTLSGHGPVATFFCIWLTKPIFLEMSW